MLVCSACLSLATNKIEGIVQSVLRMLGEQLYFI